MKCEQNSSCPNNTSSVLFIWANWTVCWIGKEDGTAFSNMINLEEAGVELNTLKAQTDSQKKKQLS